LKSIVFNKVKAHSGIELNEVVDKLASEAINHVPGKIELEVADFEDLYSISCENSNRYSGYQIDTDDIEMVKEAIINICNDEELNIVEEHTHVEDHIQYSLCVSDLKITEVPVKITQYSSKSDINKLTIQGKSFPFFDILCEVVEQTNNSNYVVSAARIANPENEKEHSMLIDLIIKDNPENVITDEITGIIGDCVHLLESN